MSYALVIPKEKKIKSEYKVRGSYLKHNKLWSVNNGELLLHKEEEGFNFLREIGFDTALERVDYLRFTDKQMKDIFKHYIINGELLTVTFKQDEMEDYELAEFLRSIRLGSILSDNEVEKLVEVYEYVVNDLIGSVWYFTVVKNNLQIKIYQNSILSILDRKNTNSEETSLSIYKEIFESIGLSFDLSPIVILEKEKIEHPLMNAYSLLNELFSLSETEAKTNLGLDESEVARIKKYILENAKSFENKTTYVE